MQAAVLGRKTLAHSGASWQISYWLPDGLTTMRQLLFRLTLIFGLLVLPFITLIRTSVYLHDTYAFGAWGSIIGGVLASALLIFLYLAYLQRLVPGNQLSLQSMRRTYWVALSLVTVYCLPALFYLSATNAKHPEVREEFTSIHPVLRIGISTLVFLDKSLLLTDAARQPEDYRRMGLRTKRHSLHYKQSSGYAHAVDIRTRGHGNLRNSLINLYFRIMGFNTLRHVGTADHLHVSISSLDRRGGI